jgi:hypothetical protein
MAVGVDAAKGGEGVEPVDPPHDADERAGERREYGHAAHGSEQLRLGQTSTDKIEVLQPGESADFLTRRRGIVLGGERLGQIRDQRSYVAGIDVARRGCPKRRSRVGEGSAQLYLPARFRRMFREQGDATDRRSAQCGEDAQPGE